MNTVYKNFVAEAEASENERRIKFLLTTEGVDRDGDTIALDGWNFNDYMKNPVVLWAHESWTPPIARAISIERTERGLESVAEFPTPGIHALSDTIFNLIKEGYLRGVSVGFRPREHKQTETGYHFTAQDLLEYSIVPIPSNPEALLSLKSSGTGLDAILDRFAKMADRLDAILTGHETHETKKTTMEDIIKLLGGQNAR